MLRMGSERKLGLLVNALKIKNSGFFLVETADKRTMQRLVARIKTAMNRANKKTAGIDFRKLGKDSIPTFVRNQTAVYPDAQVFFIKNLEAKAGKTPANLLRQLNQSRESIFTLKKNFIFLLSSSFKTHFTVYAPDLYSWIPHRYYFGNRDAARGEIDIAPIAPLNTKIESLRKAPRKKKYSRHTRKLINLYQSQLKYAPDDEVFRMMNIIKPLADLYHEVGDSRNENRFRRKIANFHKNTGT